MQINKDTAKKNLIQVAQAQFLVPGDKVRRFATRSPLALVAFRFIPLLLFSLIHFFAFFIIVPPLLLSAQGFPMGGMVTAPANRGDADTVRAYLLQVRPVCAWSRVIATAALGFRLHTCSYIVSHLIFRYFICHILCVYIASAGDW